MTAVPNDCSGPKLFATRYDRTKCDIGFVHLGFGAFHRAHQAVYIDDYMEESGDLGWGIAAVNLRASEADAFRSMQRAEDGYLLKTTAPGGRSELRLVRAHCRFVDWSEGPLDAEILVSLPTTHAITITVTESGYYLRDDWSLNADDPIIAAEISGTLSNSVYAYLARALMQRAEKIDQPINILCCDNIRSNGQLLRQNFLNYLHLTRRDDLATWVRQHVSFPCSMVDRITPRATAQLNAEMSNLFPDRTLNPIHGEAFMQWVLERRFKAPMPALEKVGVEIVDDVDPYEEAKIRILNGGHTGLCYLGALAGHNTFDQVMSDPRLRKFFDDYQTGEVLPGLNLKLPFDKHEYLADIAARFGNAAIADQLERLCMDGYSKMPIYIRPTLRSCLEQGIEPRHGYGCVASWYVYARRFASGLMPIHYHEPYWDRLNPLLVAGQELTFANSKQLWGDLPVDYPEFASGLVAAIDRMEEQWPA